jgi:gliding motility-associated-like protein
LVRLSNNSINSTSVKWDFGDGITADNINYPAHVYEKPGKYIITLYVYGPGGLTGTYLDSITIQQPTASLKVDKKLGCIGLVSTLKGTIKSATSFTWDFGDGTLLSNKDTIVSHQYNIPGIYQPALVLIDTNGCNSFVSLNESITIRKNPVITITPVAPLICRGQSVVLTANGGITYTWSPSKGLSNTGIAAPNASPDSNTLYRLTVKDDIGCSNKDSLLVTVVQKQKVKVSADTAICLGKTTQLIASGAAVYNWINITTGLSNTSIPNPVTGPVVNTTFTVTGSDVYKCFSDTARITVLVLPLPTVTIPPVQDILLGSPVPLLSNYTNDVVQWTWSPSDYLSCTNCPAPVSTPLAAITYHLLVKNNVGCTATAEVTLKLQCQESRVFIPSAFSPNNDGNNDLFSIKGISIVKHMIVFNRWGKPVYERSNYIASDRNNGWDGTYKGDLLPAGAYTYFAEMDCPSGGSFVKKGTVMLIR